MNTRQFKVETGLQVDNCITCGITYAMPTEFLKRKEQDHKYFYCPRGHTMYYPQITKEELLERKLESCKISNEANKRESRYHDYRARYYKGKVTKIQKTKEVEL